MRNAWRANAAPGVNSHWLSSRAERDLFEIFLSGIELFGMRQAARYRDDLEECFQLIADNPRIGRKAENLRKGVRRHEHGSHVIFYAERASGIEILAVMHGRRLPKLDLE